MKHNTLRLSALALMALSAVCALLASCGKEKEEPSPLPVMPTLESLTGSEWEGRYDTPVEYQGSPITMTLVWTFDFLTDTTGTVLVEISSQFSQTEYNDFAFSYNYDGVSAGHIYTGGEEESFVVDPVGQTVTIDLQTPVGLGDEGNQAILGGVTTLYRIR